MSRFNPYVVAGSIMAITAAYSITEDYLNYRHDAYGIRILEL